MSDLLTVRELKALDASLQTPFSAVLLVRGVSSRTARSGNAYLAVELGDETGTFRITCFDDGPAFALFAELPEGTPVRVDGVTEYYQDRFSPRVNRVERVAEEELESGGLLERLVASSPEDRTELRRELERFIAGIQRSRVRATVENALGECGEAFFTAPAAIGMHHAYRSGLLEHTVHLCRACAALAPHYPEVDPDLAMAGVILHDIGKVVEYSGALVTRRTRPGILNGHVVLGYRVVRKAALRSKLEPDLAERLEHIVLSHQGELEWGAAALAATPEAVFVSMIDNLDAKMGMVQHAVRTTPEEEEFSDYLPGLKTRLLTTPPLAGEE